MKFKHLSLTIAALCVAGSAFAVPAAPKLGVVYDAGGKFDKSFNQSAFEGLQRFSKETGIKVLEVQANSDTQAEQVMRGLARKKIDLIAAIGFSQTQAVQKVATEFPNVRFVLFDSIESHDPTALIGLPLIWVAHALRRFGLDPLGGA